MAKESISNIFKGLFKKSGPEGELKEFLAMSAKDPTDMRLKIKVGELYFKKKDIRNGIAWFREVAEHYGESGFLLKAIAIYKNILKFSPGSVEFNEKLGELYAKMGMRGDASQQFQIVVHYYLTHQKGADAIRACQKLVEAEPGEPRHRLRLAEIYFNQGMQDESLKEYEKLARELRKEMKHLDILVEVYEKILLKKPKELGLLKELCIFYLKLKNPQKALRKIEKYKLEQDEHFKPIYAKALQLKEYLAKTDVKENTGKIKASE
ncbi:MAG: tetratricopeptide repeat protein [Deltaproteobacteria bacterium]|nr:tetratricopeptide repeat protein [Deltaproteobacteria bacterium]